jgi:hypothetical protein
MPAIRNHRLLPAFVLSIVVLLSVLAWLPALRGGFVWNDVPWVEGALPFIPFFESEYHRPATETLMLVEFRVFEEWAMGYHGVSLALHLLAGFFLYLLARRIPIDRMGALLAALVFLLHPAQAEAVAWVGAQAWPLAGCLFLGSLLGYAEYEDSGRKGLLAGAALLQLLAALAAQAALTLPLALLLFAIARRGREAATPRLTLALGASLGVVLLYALVQRGPGEIFPPGQFNPLFGGAYFEGLGLLMARLAAPVGTGLVFSFTGEPLYFLAAVTPICVAGVLYREGYTRGAVLLAWGTLMAMSPALHILLGERPLVGDRYLYLALAGPALFCGALLVRMKALAGRIALAGLIVAVLVWGAHARAGDFSSPEAFWDGVLLRQEDASIARYNRSLVLIASGREAEGVRGLVSAFEDPSLDIHGATRALRNLRGTGAGFDDDEIFAALSRYRSPGTAHLFLGSMYFFLSEEDGDGRSGKALGHLRDAVLEDDGLVDAQFYLGLLLARRGEYAGAREHILRARSLDTLGYYADDLGKLLPALDSALGPGGS